MRSSCFFTAFSRFSTSLLKRTGRHTLTRHAATSSVTQRARSILMRFIIIGGGRKIRGGEGQRESSFVLYLREDGRSPPILPLFCDRKRVEIVLACDGKGVIEESYCEKLLGCCMILYYLCSVFTVMRSKINIFIRHIGYWLYKK